MHASLHHTANSGHQVHGRSNPDNAGRRTDDIHNIIGATAGTDGIPMRIESAYRDGNAGLEPQLLGPVWREPSRDLI